MDPQETQQLLSLLLFYSIVKINSFAVQEVAAIIMHKLGKAVYPWANVQIVMTSGHTSFFIRKNIVHATLCMATYFCPWGTRKRQLTKSQNLLANPVLLKMKINSFLSRFLSKNSLLSSILAFLGKD